MKTATKMGRDLVGEVVLLARELKTPVNNEAFAAPRWGETFSDEVVAEAAIARLVHHAHGRALDGESCLIQGPPTRAASIKTT